MAIRFTVHARRQMQERNLSESEIVRTVEKPKKVTKQLDGTHEAVGYVNRNNKKYLLVVIYSSSGSRVKIITTFLTSKIAKYL